MKLSSLMLSAIFAASPVLSTGAVAASDMDKSSATEAQSGKSTTKKVRPHNHMEEKTGVPAKTPEGASDATVDKSKVDKPTADKDKSKHFHPRDGK